MNDMSKNCITSIKSLKLSEILHYVILGSVLCESQRKYYKKRLKQCHVLIVYFYSLVHLQKVDELIVYQNIRVNFFFAIFLENL